MAAPKKGTATPLGAVFSPEETKRAVARVSESIADRRAELGRLQGFVADNAALVSLVNRLPDELTHEIMVPFGGAAFFPGRLIHTNELLVWFPLWNSFGFQYTQACQPFNLYAHYLHYALGTSRRGVLC